MYALSTIAFNGQLRKTNNKEILKFFKSGKRVYKKGKKIYVVPPDKLDQHWFLIQDIFFNNFSIVVAFPLSGATKFIFSSFASLL